MNHLILLAQAGTFDFRGILFASFALFALYFFMLRPQQKQQREHMTMLSSLKKGDDVVTQGGMLGKIASVQDKIVTLEVASSVKIRVLKSSIQGKVVEESTAAKAEAPLREKEEK